MTESQFETLPCFMEPTQSEYTFGLIQSAKNHVGIALTLASVQTVSMSSKISGDFIPMEKMFSTIPKVEQGFRVKGSGGGSVVAAAAILEILPAVFYPEHELMDEQLVHQMQTIQRRMATIPQTLTLEQAHKIRIAKITKRKVKNKQHSVIWAKSQGNTLTNALNDYRYRPQFGGVRL